MAQKTVCRNDSPCPNTESKLKKKILFVFISGLLFDRDKRNYRKEKMKIPLIYIYIIYKTVCDRSGSWEKI